MTIEKLLAFLQEYFKNLIEYLKNFGVEVPDFVKNGAETPVE